MKKAGDLLRDFFDNLGPGGKKGESFFSSWELIAGKDISLYTRIKDLRKGTLYIEAEHPGWVQIVELKKKLLIMRINELFPEKKINDIRVVLKRQ